MIGRFILLFLAAAVAVRAEKPPTFNRDIAPIVFTQCVECHHPGGSGPFSLVTYEEVKKRAKLLVRVTASGYMPPWLPEPGHGTFIGERRLTSDQIALIEGWWKAGSPQGAAADLKAEPHWNDDWQLGKPDLVVTMPASYTLPAGGKDVYRNFVIPQIVPSNRYLRALEFRPGAAGAVHHAFIFFDDSGDARRRAAHSKEPGFPGMDAGDNATMPDAMFLSWQPGKRPSQAPPGLAAPIQKSTDLVLQLHMRPTGKPEKIQASVALYFTDQAPVQSALRIVLRCVTIDIPPGAADHAIESSYKLPVAAELLGVLPHLHYLGKEVHGWAELPDGSKKELIYIKHWDFNWQGDYRYIQPVFLPEGSTLRMRYTYDNSAANPRNPNQPPQRVTYGTQSTDEMGELGFQLLPKNSAQRELLARDYFQTWALQDKFARCKMLLSLEPKNAEIRTELGVAYLLSGRRVEAKQHLQQALLDDPSIARTHTALAELFTQQNDLPRAIAATQRALEIDPDNENTHNNLGWLLLQIGDGAAAIPHLEKAVQLDPSDTLARENLEKAKAMARTPAPGSKRE